MLKEILVAKVFGTKCCELWWCKKASTVKKNMIVSHSAGRFVGEFQVIDTGKFNKLKKALQWRSHDKFMPGSPSLTETLRFYRNLLMSQGKVEDECTFYVWEDLKVNQYVVEQDKSRVKWNFALQRVTNTKPNQQKQKE